MNPLSKVQLILDTAIQNAPHPGPHGQFWRGLTRDEFVAKNVFGFPIVTLNDPEESTLVKALEGRAPFGADLDPPTPGATFSRMPARQPPVPEEDIAFIRQWISDGCPEEVADPEEVVVDPEAGGPADPTLHNAYWRDFDNWAMFQVTPPISEAIGRVFGIHALYRSFVQDPTQEQAWLDALSLEDNRSAISLLAERQQQTVQDHYGSPVPLLTLLDGYEKFGDDSLPDDPLRPEDPRHNMNGAGMWFMWMTFDDACLRLDIVPEFWRAHSRGLLLGLMNDGLYRGRFNVLGFSTDSGKEDMRQHVRDLADDQLAEEMMQRFRDSGLV